MDCPSSSQKSSSLREGFSSWVVAVIIAALTAPIEVPATTSNFLTYLASALYTPHSYAPSEPPPCRTRTVSNSISFFFSLIHFISFEEV